MTIVETIPASGAVAHAVDSLETTAAQSDWRSRYPARAVEVDWPATRCDRAGVDRLVASAAAVLPSERVRESRRWGLTLLLDWLADQPGGTWQQRWRASGADAAGQEWAQGPERWLRRQGKYSENRLRLMTSSLLWWSARTWCDRHWNGC